MIAWALLDVAARGREPDACAHASRLVDRQLYAAAITAYVEVLKSDADGGCASDALGDAGVNAVTQLECRHAAALAVADPVTARTELVAVAARDPGALSMPCVETTLAAIPAS